MLKKGVAPAQVGRESRLSVVEIEILAVEVESEPMLMVKSVAEWRVRKSREIERQFVRIIETHLDAKAHAVHAANAAKLIVDCLGFDTAYETEGMTRVARV